MTLCHNLLLTIMTNRHIIMVISKKGDFEMEILFIVLTIAYAIASLIIYHKLFTVFYFDVSMGCGKEVVTALFVGLILAALTIYFWYVSIPIIILVLIALFKRKQ